MWQLDNRTPFAAGRAWTRGRDGTETWLVAVKCTFEIAPDGRLHPAAEQPPVLVAPEYHDPARPAVSSLKYDLDLVRTKQGTDIIVVGHAHAPGGVPVTALDVGFRVGPVVKQLRVTGDRVWSGRSMSDAQPFTTMPIVYERAFGGPAPAPGGAPPRQWDVRNPIGTGFAASSLDGVRVPNIEYPATPIRSWSDRPAPAGFGVVAAHWAPRAQLAGTYDEAWQRHRLPLLPEDFDDRYYQCAPADQQVPGFLKGGEPVTLVNLTASGQLRFNLPRVFLGFDTRFDTGERHVHDKASLHTVILEPDVPRVSLVWHTALPCHPKVYKLNRTLIFEKQLIGGGAVEPPDEDGDDEDEEED